MYRLLNEPKRVTLTGRNFSAATQAPVPNVDSDAGVLTVADGLLLTLMHDQTPRLVLLARFEQGRVAGAAGSTVPVVVTVNGDGRKMVKTTREGRAFPTQAHPDVRAFTKITGQPWAPANVTAVDWNTGAVTVDTPNNAGTVRVYYVFGDGEIAVKASRPYGSNTGAIQLWRGPARGLHETDQADRDTAPVMFRTPQPIPQGFRLSLVIRAASAVHFDGLAPHEISIPGAEVAVQVTDQVGFAETAERQLRGG